MERELTAEFDRVFSSEPPAAISYAFSKWRDISQFVPTIADIRLLVRGWKLEQQSLKAAADREQLEVEREKGNLVDFSEVALKLKEMAKIPQPVPQGRANFNRAVERARASESLPAEVLTKEQLLEIANPTTPEAIAKKAKDRDQIEAEMQRLRQLDAQNLDGNYSGGI